MWLVLKAVLLRWVLSRSLGGLLGLLLTVALPLAGVLKIIGLPILIVLGVIAIPVLLVLAVIGLPLLFVVLTVTMLTAAIGGLLAASVAILKIAVPIFLVVIAARWLFRRMRSPGRTSGMEPGSEPAS